MRRCDLCGTDLFDRGAWVSVESDNGAHAEVYVGCSDECALGLLERASATRAAFLVLVAEVGG